jgi:hypothetical protein
MTITSTVRLKPGFLAPPTGTAAALIVIDMNS